jgi:glycosyltransferase involved in cell wall biosynthesis
VSITAITSDEDDARLSALGASTVNLRGSQSESRSAIAKLRNIAGYYLKLTAFLLRNRGCVVHFTGLFNTRLFLMDGVFLNVLLRLVARRYIYTAHNLLPHGKGASRAWFAAYRFAYRLPHKIIVHSRDAATQLEQTFHVPARKIVVSSIGLNEDVPTTALDETEARHRLGLGANSDVALFFGKADEYKGLDLLISAFGDPALDSAVLVISTWFPSSEYRNEILKLIAQSPKRRDIHLKEGFAPNEEIEVLFKGADVICLPYRAIYQSGVVFLAAAFGLPIVATDVGALGDVVNKLTGILVKSPSGSAFAAAVAEALRNKRTFSRSGIRASAERFRWQTVCAQLVTLYEAGVVKGGGSA